MEKRRIFKFEDISDELDPDSVNPAPKHCFNLRPTRFSLPDLPKLLQIPPLLRSLPYLVAIIGFTSLFCARNQTL
jgi:hypothetical protein